MTSSNQCPHEIGPWPGGQKWPRCLKCEIERLRAALKQGAAGAKSTAVLPSDLLETAAIMCVTHASGVNGMGRQECADKLMDLVRQYRAADATSETRPLSPKNARVETVAQRIDRLALSGCTCPYYATESEKHMPGCPAVKTGESL